MSKKLINIWEGTYPLIIYTFLVSFLVEVLCQYTPLDNYGMVPVGAAAKLVCILPMLYFYNKSPKRQAKTKHKIKDGLFILLTAICLSVAFNNIISLTPLKAWSPAYGEVEGSIAATSFVWMIISAGIIAPILEELVFRGILFGNYRASIGVWPTIIASAAIFGLMHYNLVQFVYAFLMGIFFAYLMEKTGEIWTCMLAHIGANVFSVLMTQFGISKWMFSDVTLCLIIGIVSLVVAVVILVKWKKL